MYSIRKRGVGGGSYDQGACQMDLLSTVQL
jgi:hypothetical protein